METLGFEQMYAAAFNPINNLQSLFTFFAMGSLAKLVTLFHNFDLVSDQYQAAHYDRDNTFDFIIVGAGSAGSVVANRLSVDYKVLLLEAGGEPSPITEIPAFFFPMLRQPHIDWSYFTTPQKNACLANNNRKCYLAKGLCLGGSSTINGMVYIRGHPNDFDSWANKTQDPRWSWENVLPVFKKQEDYHGKWEDSEYHSKGGDIKVTENQYGPLADEFMKAGIEKGYEDGDINARFSNTFSKLFSSQYHARRFGTLKAFLEPARRRKNLTIYKYARAQKILFKGSENDAYGVEYERHGVKGNVFANKEIIISAGTTMSPHLLMHSGIGPRSHLESHNIPVIADLPVGENLQDHLSGLIGPFLIDKPKPPPSDANDMFEMYRINGTGPLSSSSITAMAFVVSSAKSKELDWPDLQWAFIESGKIYRGIAKDYSNILNIPESTLKKFYDPIEGKDAFVIANILSRPKQTGTITLASSNPNDYPLINPKFLSEPEDMKLLIEGTHRIIDLVENTKAFQALGAHLSQIPFPGCENLPFRSDYYWECFYRHFALLGLHLTGTCSMGHRDSKETVVDSELRVLGTKGLRVIDASVMPTITTGNPNAATMMIGDMGSNFIKDHWSSRNTHLS